MLENIKSPADLKKMSVKELISLCAELREKITDTVSENGGHLASNLGIVETVTAIHSVFDAPRDTVIFDVGHQCYAHKLLTGRYENFGTLRQTDGISGFTCAGESEYDVFTEGHSGASLSQALGISASNSLKGDEGYVVAVIGDGSFTNGMIYEALNNCKNLGKKLIIILNDNEMSISRNVGGFSGYLTRIRTSRKYFNAKHRLKNFFAKIPLIGGGLTSGARKTRDLAKRLLTSYNFFECMGVDYIGTADGNDLGKMLNVLKEAKTKDVCTVVHIHTKKGKGYAPAEEYPEKFHAVSRFDRGTGDAAVGSGVTFSSVFGETVCALAEKDERICAVTAAMETGTGLSGFAEKYNDRFFDVGIAEEHAVTFAAGLRKGGMLPAAVLYSTFSQRTFDQLLHDVAIQKIPLTLCIDRAGLVEGDGITHQGIFDVSEFCSVPGISVYSPETFSELKELLEKSLYSDTADIIRYPKGRENEYDRSAFRKKGDYTETVIGAGDEFFTVITYGRITSNVYEAARRMSALSECTVKIVKLVRISPLEECEMKEIVGKARAVFIAEEGAFHGGIGERFASFIAQKMCGIMVSVRAIDGFVPHGDLESLLEKCALTPGQLCEAMSVFAEKVYAEAKKEAVR